ncbi:LOW QUALITY PROTEIN: C-C motif chemokine 28 [Sceloporus undulatus]|uniref:LOW QUALITY PROTEIN: C-C motif chemokine 28 n=1 Tax=Sceloporus undulatus TaxID=8520 RepID=UPI001C4CC063|nr:LOW QUALITY PROTEIN: C-C motif chemokine 28 [Sceloporus undulatus]
MAKTTKLSDSGAKEVVANHLGSLLLIPSNQSLSAQQRRSMNFSIVLFTLGVLIAHHISEAVFPIIVDCCTEVAHRVPRRWLRRSVLKFDIQKGGDLCKIPAVILYTKQQKTMCRSTQNKKRVRGMKRMSKIHQKTGNLSGREKKGSKKMENHKETPPHQNLRSSSGFRSPPRKPPLPTWTSGSSSGVHKDF